jgi:hypothetical protein
MVKNESNHENRFENIKRGKIICNKYDKHCK